MCIRDRSTLKRICLVHTLKRPWQVKTRSFNQRLYSVHSYSWVQNTTVVTEEQEQEHSDGAAAACGVGDDAATTTTPPELLQTRTSWKTRLGRQPAQPQSAVSATAPLAASTTTTTPPGVLQTRASRTTRLGWQPRRVFRLARVCSTPGGVVVDVASGTVRDNRRLRLRRRCGPAPSLLPPSLRAPRSPRAACRRWVP